MAIRHGEKETFFSNHYSRQLIKNDSDKLRHQHPKLELTYKKRRSTEFQIEDRERELFD